MPAIPAGLLDQPIDRALAAAMDAAALRQRLLAHNLANAETPNYRRLDVRFQQVLDRQLASGSRQPNLSPSPSPSPGAPGLNLATTHPSHLKGSLPFDRGAAQPAVVVRDSQSAVRNDGNNVDVDREMAYLTQNALWYSAANQLMSRRIASLRTAVTDGRK